MLANSLIAVCVGTPPTSCKVGELHPTTDGWPLLGSYVSHVHVKDVLVNGEVQTAGNGDGEVKQRLERLREQVIRGFSSTRCAFGCRRAQQWFQRPRCDGTCGHYVTQTSAECDCFENRRITCRQAAVAWRVQLKKTVRISSGRTSDVSGLHQKYDIEYKFSLKIYLCCIM